MRATTLSTLALAAAAVLALGACSADSPTGPSSGPVSVFGKGGNGGGKGGGKGKGGKPTPPPTDQIVYAAQAADLTTDIYLMNPDGTGVTRLTTTAGAGGNYLPHWTPDHSRIVFASDRDGQQHIFIMNADGTNVVRLTDTPYRDYEGVPSPDGTRIAFTRAGAGVAGIYLMNLDGSNVVRLTDGNDHHPSWSPDGTRLAFSSDRTTAVPTIWLVNADGTNPTQWADCGTYVCDYPAFSPDGSRLAVWTNWSGGYVTWYTLDQLQWGHVSQVDNTIGYNSPSWSPDGSRIAFLDRSQLTGAIDVYSAQTDGSGRTQLTTTSAADESPAWYR